MYLARLIGAELEIWRLSAQRKPLMLRGARQVGKSSAVRQLAQKFTHFIEINFDEQSSYNKIFEQYTDVSEICELIAATSNTPIIAGKTLLFLDEIQTCIPAISSLRYFYEKLPDLHVVTAGSLLEFALEDLPSFGVGRIRSLFMYPFCFVEFLMAYQEELLLKTLEKATPEKPLPEVLHDKLKHYLKRFLVIGGMPEVVRAYVVNNDILEAQRVLDDLMVSLESDFAKYKQRVATARIREVFNSVVRQIGSKFSYSYPNATLNNAQIKEVLELLKMAGLIYQVTHTTANGIPIGAEVNLKFRKYLLFDTGIAQSILGLSIGDLLIGDDFQTINKGAIAELHVGLELLKHNSPYQPGALYYWQRASRNSQAEVDYVVQLQTEIVPVEVKANTKGAMQSMYLFLEEKKRPKGVRFSLENFSSMNQIVVYPLYAVRNMLTRVGF
ncbi:MAG: ATP-binding protein [Saprospiraceae bacterium]|nr:ATP-binding protein [Saprospiraceae bacterium]